MPPIRIPSAVIDALVAKVRNGQFCNFNFPQYTKKSSTLDYPVEERPVTVDGTIVAAHEEKKILWSLYLPKHGEHRLTLNIHPPPCPADNIRGPTVVVVNDQGIPITAVNNNEVRRILPLLHLTTLIVS